SSKISLSDFWQVSPPVSHLCAFPRKSCPPRTARILRDSKAPGSGFHFRKFRRRLPPVTCIRRSDTGQILAPPLPRTGCRNSPLPQFPESSLLFSPALPESPVLR